MCPILEIVWYGGIGGIGKKSDDMTYILKTKTAPARCPYGTHK